MRKYTQYKNGPYYSWWRFLLEFLKFWNIPKMSKSWIKWSFKHRSEKMSNQEEFSYFINKYYGKYPNWWKEYKMECKKD